MTKQELDEIIKQYGGEIVFEDGCSISFDWDEGYCLYTPSQYFRYFGETIVGNFEEAAKFYIDHSKNSKAGLFQTEKGLEQFFNKPGKR